MEYKKITESVGYKNLKTALSHVFNIDINDCKMNEGVFENFNVDLHYRNKNIKLIIGSTEKETQFNFGEGGELGILLKNPDFPEFSDFRYNHLSSIVKSKEEVEELEFVSGKDIKKLERALQILKDYLDKN